MASLGVYEAAGKIVSGVILNYSKKQYLDKIDQLEGYCQKLNQHLEEMEVLKNGINNFWNDVNAQRAAQLLAIEITAVKGAMETTQETIKFYRTTVESFDETQKEVDDKLSTALNILNLLG